MTVAIPALAVHHRCCCCCGPPAARRTLAAAGAFSPEELAALEEAAGAWVSDTGRDCADFFRTLRTSTTADSFLAGRETLLTRIKTATTAAALFAEETVCARLAPAPAPTPAIPPPPPPPPPPPAGPPFEVRIRPDAFSSVGGGLFATFDAAMAFVRRIFKPRAGGFWIIRFRPTGAVLAQSGAEQLI